MLLATAVRERDAGFSHSTKRTTSSADDFDDHVAERGILVEVEHVEAHRTEQEKKDMSQFERFVTEGNEKADDLAKVGAMLDEGFMAEPKAETMQQEREEVYGGLQCAASFHCLVEQWKDCGELRPKPKDKWIFTDKKSENTEHRTEADK